jgi:hypothetical protein
VTTDKILDGAVTASKIAGGVIPSSDGWHGSTSRIKILPRDFIAGAGTAVPIVDSSGNKGGSISINESDGARAIATMPIPTGYTATKVMIYATSNIDIIVYECTISADSGTQRATGNTNSEITIAVDSTTTNYLGIQVTLGTVALAKEIYGGYVTITPTVV